MDDARFLGVEDVGRLMRVVQDAGNNLLAQG